MKKFFVFAMAAMTLSVMSCKKDGANAENSTAEGESTEVIADGLGAAAQAKGDLPYEASKVLADAQNLIQFNAYFDGSCEVSYKAIKNSDLNGVAFRCVHADKSTDYVVMVYDKDGNIEDVLATDVSADATKIGYSKKCLVEFKGTEEDPMYNLKEAAQEIEITCNGNDWFTTSGLTSKEMTEEEMKAYYEEHKDITWFDENTEWAKF